MRNDVIVKLSKQMICFIGNNKLIYTMNIVVIWGYSGGIVGGYNESIVYVVHCTCKPDQILATCTLHLI